MSYAFQANYTIRHATTEEIKKSFFAPSSFKKGDYIVLISLPIHKTKELDGYHIQYPKNYIFKQHGTGIFLASELDAKNNRGNGYDCYRYPQDNWRYATQEEIKEYDRLEEPYDVTELKQIINKQEQNGTKSKSIKVHRQNSTISGGSSKRRKPVQSRTERTTIKERSFRNTTRDCKREKTVRFTYESR